MLLNDSEEVDDLICSSSIRVNMDDASTEKGILPVITSSSRRSFLVGLDRIPGGPVAYWKSGADLVPAFEENYSRSLV